jgi:hypothetical protein|tara:strand:- start:238 stop:471 length:234 start_codon:yes stop_codon:yes gene_type:complete
LFGVFLNKALIEKECLEEEAVEGSPRVSSNFDEEWELSLWEAFAQDRVEVVGAKRRLALKKIGRTVEWWVLFLEHVG